MESIEVRFDTIRDMVGFVERASRMEEDVDVRVGSVVVDGKSIQGVVALGCGVRALAVVHTERKGAARELLPERGRGEGRAAGQP